MNGPDQQQTEEEQKPKGLKLFTSLVLSGSLALSGCPEDSTVGSMGDTIPDTAIDSSEVVDSAIADSGDAIADSGDAIADSGDEVTDLLDVPPDLPPLEDICTVPDSAPSLTLEPTKLAYADGEDMVFFATIDHALKEHSHKLDVALDVPSFVKQLEKVADGRYKIIVRPDASYWGSWTFTLTATLSVTCPDKTLVYSQQRYICSGQTGGFIVVDDPSSDECAMVCDPMPGPPDTECPEAFRGGVTLSPNDNSLYGYQLLEVTATLDPQYLEQQGWTDPQFFSNVGKIVETVKVGPGEYKIYWSQFDADCKRTGVTTGKLWAEWPVQCLQEDYHQVGYIYAELNLCLGMMTDAYVIQPGEDCPMVADPMPPAPCPDSVLTITTDKDSFNIAEPLQVRVKVPDQYMSAQETVQVEADLGSISQIKRDCESGEITFVWKMPLSLGSENAGATITSTIKIFCAKEEEPEQQHQYQQQLDLCIQPDGQILINPQTCSLFPLSTPVHAHILPLKKNGLLVELSCELDLDQQKQVRYLWRVTGGHLSAREGKRVGWVVPARTGSYLVQAFAIASDEGLGADALTVNVYEGSVRSIERT